MKLKMKFGKKTKRHQPTFGDVGVNQFFLDKDGWLSQKVDPGSYHTIADCDQEPNAWRYSANESTPVEKIFPTVKKITLE